MRASAFLLLACLLSAPRARAAAAGAPARSSLRGTNVELVELAPSDQRYESGYDPRARGACADA